MPNSTQKPKSDTTKANTSPSKAKPKSSSEVTINNESKRPRKRKRLRVDGTSDESELESELEECNLEDALAMERKLRKVAKKNSLNDEEMKKLLQKFVKNEHVLALVTLKAEDELARERRETEQPAIIITDTPSVPKLTRAKARELNKIPGITLPTLSDTPKPEIATLITEELHSDEDDEEYTFKEEDFVSDDDANNTNSDFDSNPCTPQTPLTQTEYEDSPVKLTSDGCFKIPLDKQNATQENLRIATRTRSKLSLEQTTIEDIQSEFVPPDVDLNETNDTEFTANDKDWMEFLTYVSNPLNNSLLGDDDDPVNDPEYVAADKEPVDAEELRNVNISKKELTELFAELFEGLVNEGVSLESVDLDTPEKFLQNNIALETTPKVKQINDTAISDQACAADSRLTEVTRQIDFEAGSSAQNCTTISSSYVNAPQPQDYSFPAHAMAPTNTSAIFTQNTVNAPNNSNLNFTHAVMTPFSSISNDSCSVMELNESHYETRNTTSGSKHDIVSRYTLPYDNNYTWRYISVRRHVYTEYMDKFENLRNIKNVQTNALLEAPTHDTGWTELQQNLLQQQLRIHVQMLTQTYVQIYCHPNFWKMAPGIRKMLEELQELAKTHPAFNAWNLADAIKLIDKWEEDLSTDTPENKEFMEFIHKEISFCSIKTRQVPRFPPRIMELILNSKVFMYPNYLPRIPFTPKCYATHVFAPSEYYLLALGLEKHLKPINKSKLKSTASPYVIACRQIAKDTIFGKNMRRIYVQMKKLQNTDYYNPVKYYFEHNCAPPVEQHLYTFENNTVLKPLERFNELPLAWKHYIEEKNKPVAATKTTSSKNATSAPATPPRPTALNYLDLVREAVGENIQLPDSIAEAAEPAASAADTHSDPHKRKKTERRSRKLSSSVTVNINYIFGATSNQADISSLLSSTAHCSQPNITTISVSPQRALPSTCYQSTASTTQSRPTTTLASDIIAYNYDLNLRQLQPVVADITEIPTEQTTDALTIEPIITERALKDSEIPVSKTLKKLRKIQRQKVLIWRHSHNHTKRFGNVRRQQQRAVLLHRQRSSLKKRCLQLLTAYRQNIERQELRFAKSPHLLRYFKQFKALELYTSFLDDLKLICRNKAQQTNHSNVMATGTATQGNHSLGSKRLRLDEDGGNTTKGGKKINRQEENLRNMLLPDTPEDANRKDAIYAFNFYEKVEEVFKTDNRLDDYEKFNNILKNFDPSSDRAADLYYKLEELFLPEYPLLAQVFLGFLLPAEAAEIGKFFEHFMITNSTNFYNKLNIYFSNQPAQMRKIFNCLNELAEEEDVTMKKLEEKIIPLLKGNQFLIDWFMQQFPEAPVPERLLPAPESVNLKEMQGKQVGESMETMRDILDSPTSVDQPQPPCQLRYINGRIFYGSKLTLPAKLSFMANKSSAIKDEQKNSTIAAAEIANSGCIHGIRRYGESRLAAAAVAAATTPTIATSASLPLLSDSATSDEGNGKSEEDDASKTLVIDTTSTAGEDDSCSSIETCDDATLRSHALRLNPSYYGSTCFSTMTATSTPNVGSTHQTHHPNAKKHSLNFNDDLKLSPRKQNGTPIDTTNNIAGSAVHQRERRKSPTKKLKSPNNLHNISKTQQRVATQQPMVIIPRSGCGAGEEHGAGAIAFAHKLKTLVDSSDEQTLPSTTKNIAQPEAPIVARVKQRPFIDLTASTTLTSSMDDSTTAHHNLVPKLENSDDLEFLPEYTPPHVVDEQTDFPRLQLEHDSSTEDGTVLQKTATTTTKRQHKSDSDEDYKLDIVASMTAAGQTTTKPTTSNAAPANTVLASTPTSVQPAHSLPAAFTREEDKILLLEMQAGSRDRDDLIKRISLKLPQRTHAEIIGRHQFLIDFLSRMQGN